jgi:hypothetical protein
MKRLKKLVGKLAALLEGEQTKPPAEHSTPTPTAVIPKKCATCKHWNLADGQAVMRDYPDFLRAAAVLRPGRMATTVDDEGRVKANGLPPRAQWDDFGACDKHETVTYGDVLPEWCNDWSQADGQGQ